MFEICFYDLSQRYFHTIKTLYVFFLMQMNIYLILHLIIPFIFIDDSLIFIIRMNI